MSKEPQLAFDLARTCFSRTFGDITVLGTWYGDNGEPCIVLMRVRDIGKPGVTPCVVLLSDAWRWGEAGDGAYCAHTSFLHAEVLRLNTANVNQVMRVTSIIRECLGDLIGIRPRPRDAVDKITVADVIRKDQYGKEHHTELVENV